MSKVGIEQGRKGNGAEKGAAEKEKRRRDGGQTDTVICIPTTIIFQLSHTQKPVNQLKGGQPRVTPIGSSRINTHIPYSVSPLYSHNIQCIYIVQCNVIHNTIPSHCTIHVYM